MPLTAEARRFALVRAALRTDVADAVHELVQTHPAHVSEESKGLAAAALEAYAAAAALMPYEPFLEAAERWRYDLDTLCRLFSVSYEQAAHRLATLRRPGAEGVRFAFMRSDASGYVTKRLPLPRLPLPRYGNACPLWVISSAFQTPGVTARSCGELPSGDRFLLFARALEKHPDVIKNTLAPVKVAPTNPVGDAMYRGSLESLSTEELSAVVRLAERLGSA